MVILPLDDRKIIDHYSDYADHTYSKHWAETLLPSSMHIVKTDRPSNKSAEDNSNQPGPSVAENLDAANSSGNVELKAESGIYAVICL